MIPDKAVEAALDAWFGDGEWRNGVFDKDYLASMRAALAAAAEQAMWGDEEMSKMTAEQLREWQSRDGPSELIDEVIALRARVVQLEAALSPHGKPTAKPLPIVFDDDAAIREAKP